MSGVLSRQTGQGNCRQPDKIIVAQYLILRNKILIPLLAGAEKRVEKKPSTNIYEIDSHYKNIQSEMQEIFNILKIAA